MGSKSYGDADNDDGRSFITVDSIATTVQQFDTISISDTITGDDSGTANRGSTMNALYTPIRMPEPFVPYPDDARPAMTPGQISQYKTSEQLATSAVIHAACRLHEASMVTVNVFQRLVHQWTGLSPKDAREALKTDGRVLYRDDRAGPDELQRQKAVMLQSAMEAVLTTLSLTGVIAGAAIQARGYAVEADLLLPLSVLGQAEDGKDAKPGKQGEPTTSTTFAAFTRGRTMNDLDERRIYDEAVSTGTLGNRLLHDLETSSSPYFGSYQHNVQLSVEPLRNAVYRTSLSHIKDALKQMKVVKGVVSNGGGNKNMEEAWYEVQCVIGNIMAVDIENAGETLRRAAKYGMTIAKWQRPAAAAATPKARTGLFSRHKEKDTGSSDDKKQAGSDEDELLQQAYNACKQAVKAAAMARTEYNQVVAQFPIKAPGRASRSG